MRSPPRPPPLQIYHHPAVHFVSPSSPVFLASPTSKTASARTPPYQLTPRKSRLLSRAIRMAKMTMRTQQNSITSCPTSKSFATRELELNRQSGHHMQPLLSTSTGAPIGMVHHHPSRTLMLQRKCKRSQVMNPFDRAHPQLADFSPISQCLQLRYLSLPFPQRLSSQQRQPSHRPCHLLEK